MDRYVTTLSTAPACLLDYSVGGGGREDRLVQNSLFSTQHIVHTTMFFYTYDVSKRERAEDSAYVGSFPKVTVALRCRLSRPK